MEMSGASPTKSTGGPSTRWGLPRTEEQGRGDGFSEGRRVYRVACHPSHTPTKGLPAAFFASAGGAGARASFAAACSRVKRVIRAYTVPVPPPPQLGAATVSREMYEKAGAAIGGLSGGILEGPTRQVHTGGWAGKCGRPRNTRRETGLTLRDGMMRAMCASILHCGFERFARRMMTTSPPPGFLDQLFLELQARDRVLPRGGLAPQANVWGFVAVRERGRGA